MNIPKFQFLSFTALLAQVGEQRRPKTQGKAPAQAAFAVFSQTRRA